MAWIEGTAGNDNLLGTGSDDSLLGYGGDDTLDGQAGNDQLEGGEGADQLTGGDGFDYASYLHAAAGQVADLLIPSLNAGAAASGDRYHAIEGLIGSAFRDSLRGDYGNNYLFGLEGNDSLYGRDGVDTLVGGDGDDFLEGGPGSDYLIGGAGFDHVLYSSATSAVTVDLLDQMANAGDAAMDYFDSIEAFAGSAFDDSLRGSNGNEYLIGEAGRDSLYGRGGNDTLIGGEGDDYLTGGAGADLLVGGGGIDLAMYTHAPTGVMVSLVGNAGYSGEANGDGFIGIEGIAGSFFADQLIGDESDNIIFGEAGDDDLYGGGGNDSFVGGSGNDRFSGGAGQDLYVFGPGDGQDIIEYITYDRGPVATPIDVIHLSRALGVNSFADVLARSQQVGPHTIITFDANTSIQLSEFSLSLLTADNFFFYG